MIQLTLDASVVFKWLAPDVEEEDLADVALGLLAKIRAGGVGLVQPVHWLAGPLPPGCARRTPWKT